MTYTQALPIIIERLRGVIIENRSALEVILKHDGDEALHYVDPPYLHETRGRNDGYRHEVADKDHVVLAEVLKRVRGKVILSGYPSALYDRIYGDWSREEHVTCADGGRPRVEVLWMNY